MEITFEGWNFLHGGRDAVKIIDNEGRYIILSVPLQSIALRVLLKQIEKKINECQQ